MDLSNLEDLRVALKVAGIRPQKEMGQNFLADRASLEAVVDAAELSADDTVLEVGSGLGTLTRLLAERAGWVVTVESDARLAGILHSAKLPNVQVETGDILRFDLTSLPKAYKVVANIPYYLTSKLIRDLLEAQNAPTMSVLLVQKEVAERVCAGPGDMSVLALSVQYYTEPDIAGVVERDKFWPRPEVDSAILRLRKRGKPAFEAEPARLFRLAKAGFGERRKMLKNSLAGGLNAEEQLVAALLSRAGIDSTKRAQELTLKDWHKLYNETTKHKLI